MNKFFHIFLLLICALILANGAAIIDASALAVTLWFEKLLPSMFVGRVFCALYRSNRYTALANETDKRWHPLAFRT